MRILSYKRKSGYILPLFFLMISAGVWSCKQEFEKTIPDIEANDSVNVVFGKPKVLYLIVDGARGTSVQQAQTTHISSLLNTAIYSWFGVSDEEASENGANWASMITGVGREKHGVINNDFSQNNFQTFPTVFQRVADASNGYSSKVFTSSALFEQYLAEGAEGERLTDDAAVKAAVIKSIREDSTTMIVGQFSAIDKAGAQEGYDISVAAYRDAILQFDETVGEMMAALESRPTYKEENWLVIIASNKGGAFEIPDEENDNTIFSNPKANTFLVYYSPKYRSRFIAKPYLGSRYQGSFLRFQGNLHGELTGENNDVYNLGGPTEAFTIELKVKKNIGPNNNYKFYYPSLLGKRPEWSSGWPSVGWVVFLEDNFWMFNARGTSGAEQVRGGTLGDATWNSIAVVGVIRDNKRFVRTFTNGRFNNERDITDWGNLNNAALLKLGYINGNGHREPDAYISDVRIWKAALPDDVISQYACGTSIDEQHPYYDYLAGYWPVVGSEGDMIMDEGPLGSHLALKDGTPSWDNLNEFLCAPSASDLGSLVPRNQDIPAQIISWLKIPRQESWQLDGRVWLDQ